MEYLMEIVLFLCCVILITFLLALFEERVNFAWVLCAFMILKWMIDGEIAYILPASSLYFSHCQPYDQADLLQRYTLHAPN